MSHSFKCFNIFVCGEAKSGKTTLINRIIDDRYTHCTCPTIQCNYFRKEYKIKEDSSYVIKYWDTRGVMSNDSSYSSSLEFYKYAQIVLICVSVSDRRSLENLHSWIEYLNEYTRSGYECIIVLTKLDEQKWDFTLDELDFVLNTISSQKLAYVSSESGRGIRDLENLILEIVNQKDLLNEQLQRNTGRFSLSLMTVSSKSKLAMKNNCC